MNPLSYPSGRNDDVANMTYYGYQHSAPPQCSQTDYGCEYYNDDGWLYTHSLQQPYVVMRENKDTVKFSGDMTQFAYFW